MKLALLMNEHSYPGRQYLDTMLKHDLQFDTILFTKESYKEIDLYEEKMWRLWRPSKLSEQKDYNSFFISSMMN